jgi:hypothetical protein
LEFGIAVKGLQQRVAHEVGVGEESAFDTVAEHVKGGGFVAEDGIDLGDFVEAFGIGDAALFDAGLGLA